MDSVPVRFNQRNYFYVSNNQGLDSQPTYLDPIGRASPESFATRATQPAVEMLTRKENAQTAQPSSATPGLTTRDSIDHKQLNI